MQLLSAVVEICFETRASIMAVRVVELSNEGYKLEIFLPRNQHIQRKLLNFEFWINGELSKSAKI